MDKLNVLHYTSGVARNVELAGHRQIRTLHCRRQCMEERSADQSAQSVEIFFRLHFSVVRMGSHGTFVLCTVRSRCLRIDAAERRSGEG